MLKQHRTTQRHIPRGREDEERLVGDMIEFARQYGRYGYRRVAALLGSTGWHVNDKREPPRVYWRVKLSKDGPYDTEKTYPELYS